MAELVSSTLENRGAVVTGGSRGIGRAIALELAKRGAGVNRAWVIMHNGMYISLERFQAKYLMVENASDPLKRKFPN